MSKPSSNPKSFGKGVALLLVRHPSEVLQQRFIEDSGPGEGSGGDLTGCEAAMLCELWQA